MYQQHIPFSFAYKLVCVDDKFSKPIVVLKENVAFKFIKVIFKEYEYCKKVMEKHVNKNLIINEKEEQKFQSSNMCWICEKLIDVGSKVLELLKQKDAYLREYMNSFKRFNEKKIP